jgi:hypothetical protein
MNFENAGGFFDGQKRLNDLILRTTPWGKLLAGLDFY